MPNPIDLAKKALGQQFIVGFSGLELSDETSAFISQAGIGGVILFAHNYESPGQVAELLNQVQECRSRADGALPLWTTVDHEGGRVQRFKKGFTKIPDAASIAAMDSPKLAFDVAEVMGRELKAVGINVCFAPIADINTNPRNPVIGTRAYGSTEDVVSKMATAVVRGLMVAEVQPCVKHFPGHGDTSVDSHFALPKVDTDLKTLLDRELKPFVKAFKSRCSMVMTAHLMVPALDPDLPATLSRKILKDLLREQLRFGKLIISDDMEMKAIADHFGADDAPRLAIQAGCDMLIYRSEATARRAYQAVGKALEDGRLSPDIVLAAEARIRALKKECLLPYSPTVVAEVGKHVGTPANLAIVEKIAVKATQKT